MKVTALQEIMLDDLVRRCDAQRTAYRVHVEIRTRHGSQTRKTRDSVQLAAASEEAAKKEAIAHFKWGSGGDSFEVVVTRVEKLNSRADGGVKRNLEGLQRDLGELQKQLENLLRRGGAQNDPETVKDLRSEIEALKRRMKGDAEHKRMFPAYTLAQLKERLPKVTDPDTKKKMENEIAAREAGTSQHLRTPQAKWDGCAVKADNRERHALKDEKRALEMQLKSAVSKGSTAEIKRLNAELEDVERELTRTRSDAGSGAWRVEYQTMVGSFVQKFTTQKEARRFLFDIKRDRNTKRATLVGPEGNVVADEARADASGFKVGDRVKFIEPEFPKKYGKTGRITKVYSDDTVTVDNGIGRVYTDYIQKA